MLRSLALIGACLCLTGGVQQPASASVPFLFAAVSPRLVTEKQTGPIRVNWELWLPDRSEPLHGASDTWKEAPIFPRIPGSKLRFYWSLIPDDPRPIGRAVWTDDQRTKREKRPAMNYELSKGWCFEVHPGGDGPNNQRLALGMHKYWADLAIEGGKREYGKLFSATLTKRVTDRWQEWEVNFGLYEPAPGVPITDDSVLGMQQAKGAQGLSFAPPRGREVVVEEDRQSDRHRPVAPKSAATDLPFSHDAKPLMTPEPNRPSSQPSDQRGLKLEIEGFPSLLFRIEPEGIKPYWLTVTDKEEVEVGLPSSCRYVNLYACQSEQDRGVRVKHNGVLEPFPLQTGELLPVKITRTPVTQRAGG